MELSFEYTPVAVNKPELVRQLLASVFGFSLIEPTGLRLNPAGIALSKTDECAGYLLLNKKSRLANSRQTPILIHTKDCLKDYHSLISASVEIIAKPEYTDQGLSLSFADKHGNQFTLLEKRNYCDI